MSFRHSIRGDVPSLAQHYSEQVEILRSQGKPVIALHVGQPSTPAPKGALEAVVEAEEHELLGYTSGVGLRALRQRISLHYKKMYQLVVDPERIVVTIGASGALILALIACFDAKAKIAIPYPVYPAYIQVMKMLDIDIVPISTTFENNFQVTLDDLKNLKEPFDGLIVASPSNPTGCVLHPHELEAIIEYCNQHDIQLISDEIYHGLVYDGAPELVSAVAYDESVLVMNSFSKYYSMPGWRVGWLVVPEGMVDSFASCARNLYISPPAPSQYAALAAMDCRQELDHHVVRYERNRNILVEKLPDAGFHRFCKPDGAFYMYVAVDHLTEDVATFADKILQETYISTMPGSSFDPYHGGKFLRLSYAGSTQEIEEAANRLIKWRKHS